MKRERERERERDSHVKLLQISWHQIFRGHNTIYFSLYLNYLSLFSFKTGAMKQRRGTCGMFKIINLTYLHLHVLRAVTFGDYIGPKKITEISSLSVKYSAAAKSIHLLCRHGLCTCYSYCMYQRTS